MTQRFISIRRTRNCYHINLVELLDERRGHGLQINIYPNRIEIYGFGDGFPSSINMFQSKGVWHWSTLDGEDVVRILRNNRISTCEDIAQLLYTIVSMSNDPILIAFTEKFIRRYSMHGEVICANLSFSAEDGT